MPELRCAGLVHLDSAGLTPFQSTGPFCFTFTEARWLIGDGGRGRKSEGSTADTARKRPERPLDRRQNNGSVREVSVPSPLPSWAAKVGLFSLRVVPQQQCNGHCPGDSAQHDSSNSNRAVHWRRSTGSPVFFGRYPRCVLKKDVCQT